MKPTTFKGSSLYGSFPYIDGDAWLPERDAIHPRAGLRDYDARMSPYNAAIITFRRTTKTRTRTMPTTKKAAQKGRLNLDLSKA
jgi:hypothetical protein